MNGTPSFAPEVFPHRGLSAEHRTRDPLPVALPIGTKGSDVQGRSDRLPSPLPAHRIPYGLLHNIVQKSTFFVITERLFEIKSITLQHVSLIND